MHLKADSVNFVFQNSINKRKGGQKNNATDRKWRETFCFGVADESKLNFQNKGEFRTKKMCHFQRRENINKKLRENIFKLQKEGKICVLHLVFCAITT